jgi:hypothetical protein
MGAAPGKWLPEVTGMAEPDDGAWRDERRIPLAELDRAMATYSADGQVDDPTGGDAGAEEAFGEELAEGPSGGDAEWGDPDPDSEEGRRLRPSPEGHSGPA